VAASSAQRKIHPAQCREQQDAAIAILEAGWMNDGVQQQTQRAEFLSAIALNLD